MNALHYLGAVEALGHFRARTLSPVELMQAVIERAEVTEPLVNALCEPQFDAALERAREAELRYGRRGPDPRPLEGLPVGLKAEEPVAGQPWSHGSLLYRDQVADDTSPAAERILAAGGIVHARTTTPEFSCAAYTHSHLWGVTRNPWNLAVGVGGSSGGSGAALAAGTATLASGSDIAGSIRIPAAFNGVVGFKPPYGRVPQQAPFNLDTYCHTGPMARSVADCALMENVLAGPHPRDATSLRWPVVLPLEPEGAAGLRVALSLDLGDWPVDPEVRDNAEAAADALRAAGAIVEHVDLHLPQADVLRAVATHFGLAFAGWISGESERAPGQLTAYARDLPRWCETTSGATSYLEMLELEAEIQERVGALLERYHALVCPTVGTRGFTAGDDYVEHGVEVDGRATGHHLEATLTTPFNIASRCPVLAVPSGLARNGVPTGVQIVGRTYDDPTVFRLGAALERERPWPRDPQLEAAHA